MQQKVTVVNKEGRKLLGILHETGSPQIVLLCHGFRCTKDGSIMVNLATALEKEGITAFRFDFSGNGESEGPFQYSNYSGEVEDLRSVVEYFAASNRSTIALIGHSKGGNIVLLYASKYHDIPAVVNVSGRYHCKGGIEERFGKDVWERLSKDGYVDAMTKTGEFEYRVTEESVMERVNLDMREPCLLIDPSCRLLTVHGSGDKIIPVEEAKEFDKILRNHELKIIRKANHGYSSHQDKLVAAVLPFLKESLQQHSTTITATTSIS